MDMSELCSAQEAARSLDNLLTRRIWSVNPSFRNWWLCLLSLLRCNLAFSKKECAGFRSLIHKREFCRCFLQGWIRLGNMNFHGCIIRKAMVLLLDCLNLGLRWSSTLYCCHVSGSWILVVFPSLGDMAHTVFNNLFDVRGYLQRVSKTVSRIFQYPVE